MPEDIWPGTAGTNRQRARVRRSLDAALWEQAVYTDAPITTQWDDGIHDGPNKGKMPTSSSSMPTMVFSMLQALDVQCGQRILEIGTGTGWNTALLCHRTGDQNVVTIERDGELAQEARNRLYAEGYAPYIVIGDGSHGFGRRDPYDRIIATCSVGQVPTQWIGQALPGAVIVAPWGPGYGGEAIARLEIDEFGVASGHFVQSSAFMRMSPQRKKFPSITSRVEEYWPERARVSATSLSPDDVGDWLHMFAIGVQVPDLFCQVENGEDGTYRLWLSDTTTRSVASADYAPGLDRYMVAQSGMRRLWTELESAWRWWDKQGRPDFSRFGLTTTGAENFMVWLDSPDNPVPNRVGGGPGGC
ncbi:rRNA adenine N-6-methyltransferase family protein [Streptomyces sp. NBC_00470]|uniref:rRNA adenine N-6-methyltransferase family protein n=1 Tax=Streptomyces sp. NBC_00470 TaxID=2975753 RepID=UPI0030E496E6